MNISVFNFRMLSSYPSKDSRTIKENLFYRGGPFQELDENDKQFLNSLNLKYVIDFRSQEEIKKPLYIPSDAKYLNICAFKRENEDVDLDTLNGVNKDEDEDWLANIYKVLPFNNDAYRKVFECLIENDLPIYFHCSAGKDRTGVCSMLIMKLLDIDDEYIYEEYLKSMDFIKEYYHNDFANLPRNYLAHKEWLEGSINEIYKRYRSIDEFFLKEYQIDNNLKNKIKNNCLI